MCNLAAGRGEAYFEFGIHIWDFIAADLILKEAGDLKLAVVLTESGSSRDPAVVDFKRKNIQNIVQKCFGIRCYGSSVTNLCNIAAGRGEAYIKFGIRIWDFIAANLIIKEAGGVILDTAGGEINRMNRRVLGACSKELAEGISSSLTQRYMGSD